MKRMMFAITIAAAASVAVCETSNAAPIATVLAPATTSADNVLPAHYYRGHYYPYRWHGHYYRYHSHGHYYGHRHYRHGHYYYW